MADYAMTDPRHIHNRNPNTTDREDLQRSLCWQSNENDQQGSREQQQRFRGRSSSINQRACHQVSKCMQSRVCALYLFVLGHLLIGVGEAQHVFSLCAVGTNSCHFNIAKCQNDLPDARRVESRKTRLEKRWCGVAIWSTHTVTSSSRGEIVFLVL